MVKIKRKVEMTHEEYAKYLIDKFGIASYERELIDNNIFDVPMEFEQTFTLKSMRKDEDPVIERSFKGVVIEVEEEITEDTEFEKLYYTTILSRIVESSCTTIQSSLKHIAVEPIAFYILNDDLTMTLIWRDGRLIK